MEIEATLGRECVGGRIEFVDRVAGVALEQKQAGIAEFERPVTGADDRQRCRIQRELLIERSEQLHRIGITTGE